MPQLRNHNTQYALLEAQCTQYASHVRPSTQYLMHTAGNLVATPANYETVTSFLLRVVIQQLKIQKDSFQID